MNTIGDMQNEMDFYGQCNEFVYNHDYVKFSKRIVFDSLEYVILDSDVYLLFRRNNFTI